MLLPSPAYMRSTEDVRRSWLFPWYYVRRPLRFLARRGRAILSRQNRSESEGRAGEAGPPRPTAPRG